MSGRLLVLVLLAWSCGSVIKSAAQLSDLPGQESQGLTATITGTVRTADNHPVPDAHVVLRATLNEARFSTYSRPDGSFELTNVPDGPYLLSATLGILEVSDQIQVSIGENWVNLTMPPKEQSGADRRAPVSAAQLSIPGKARNALQKAWDALGKNKLVDAARYIEKALVFCPRYAEALTMRAMLELQGNSREMALADAEKAIEYDPNYGTAYIILGSAYNSLGRFDDAVRTLDHGIAITPDTWQGYYEMSKALLAKGDSVAALHQAEKASSLLGPLNYPALHLVKAYAYIRLKNQSAASAELEAYQRLEPQGHMSAEAKQMLEKLRVSSADK